MNYFEYIPNKDEFYVRNELSKLTSKILSSGIFFPFMITGETGVGKTYPVIQECALSGRECIRVNLSKRSNEYDLIGNFRLIDGNTVFEKGPVVLAMERGAVLLLDEIDAIDPEEALCLQSILEGSGYYIKAINEKIEPLPGFTIIATANTKGLGDETGKYIGTNILNEAFLERFIMIYEVKYPSIEHETEILLNYSLHLGLNNNQFVGRIVEWANKVRDAVEKSQGEFSHNISTRRLIHLLKTLLVFKSEAHAMLYCMSRFDDYHKEAFLSFYDASYGGSESELFVKSIHDQSFIDLYKTLNFKK